MKTLYPWIGWFYIATAIGGLMVWAFAEPSRWFSAVVSSNVSLLVAGGLCGLLVFGILMVIGESDTRGR